jgi:acyl-CoA reductase-like NAD-dependent aldehyde dehydrogenase
VCIRVQRLLVHRPVYDHFVARFVETVRGLRCGNPLEEETVVGPLIDAAAADRVERWIREAVEGGARVLAGGERRGNVIEPTVLTGTHPGMRVEAEEVFGPAVTVRPYDDFEEAIALVNQGEYGLQAGIFTRDVNRIWQAYRELEVGGVVVGDYPMLRVDNFPYGGIKGSGFGREGPAFAAEEMTEVKTMLMRVGG